MKAMLGALALALGAPTVAFAQMDMPGMQAAPAASAPAASTPVASASPSTPMPGMDMGGTSMSDGAAMPGMAMMAGDLGAYPMTRDASGTAWQPDSSPMEDVHARFGPWTTMLHGNATLDYDNQGGPRGGDKTFVESKLMGVAQREIAGGVFTARGMFSLDPLMGKSGYPLLLGTGETANGRTPLVDRQHPHDFLMELAGEYSHPITRAVSGFVYLGYPGEPALGPVTFMHRFSGMANPEAPIDHHWLDSTHITFGVVTAGVTAGPVKLEASSFTGREPNQHRWDFDHPRFDSWSVRATVNPTRDLSLQVSTGYLHSPEQLEPLTNQRRTTASATYNRPLSKNGRAHGNWQTTLAWGRDENDPGHTLDAYLLESAFEWGPDTVFGRAENADKDELYDDDPTNPLYRRVFNVSKISLGYFHTFPLPGPFAVDFGGLASGYGLPSAIKPAYGGDPTSFMLFTRIKLR